MKKQIDLYFLYGSASYKPSCRAVDHLTGEIVAFCTRDSWVEVEKATLRDTEKHYTYGPPPPSKIVEIEIEDSFPDNVIDLTDVLKKRDPEPPAAA